ncbi:unnamed protein product [Cylicocyclus nassatus]|uniref:Uncharacterized protein n=1 Tax=Cylicocyclus nassatus TaxID=53992 RepID=A0AA36MFW3_CYLNA|nr:unnamed protein product [Cylicocyclus nassatus]
MRPPLRRVSGRRLLKLNKLIAQRFNNDFYKLLYKYQDGQRRFNDDEFANNYITRPIKRFPVGLYYSLMGEDLTETNPKRSEDDLDSVLSGY